MPRPRITGRLVFDPASTSAAAQRWRADPDVQLAFERVANPLIPYRSSNRKIWLRPGNASSEVSLADMGYMFELAFGDVGVWPRQATTEIGIGWWGIGSQQSVTDSAVFHDLLWRLQPDLVIEIGTWCGGSTVFLAKSMIEYNPNATIHTFDLIHPEHRCACPAPLTPSQLVPALNFLTAHDARMIPARPSGGSANSCPAASGTIR